MCGKLLDFYVPTHLFFMQIIYGI